MSTPSRIAVLPPELADQIAAGEVVERAASVVKELCENALDAGARRIEVDLEGGGRRLIRVVDDGCGMTPEEARLALKRHATSKITTADDLWTLKSFGFRGEALPSIAAVSRLSLSTKVRAARAGFRLDVAAGTEVDAGDIGIPDGTQIEVRDLFSNTPARLKFQKTDATESTNAQEALLRLGLSHPEVHFRLRLAGRLALDLPPHRDLAERVRAALARRGIGALHEIEGAETGHRVHAFVAAPAQAAATARSTFLFVGGRFVRDRALLHALAQGYGPLLDKGRYPLAVLFLEVPGAELDVNVHPQKLEVRFARAAEVYAAVRHVVAAGVTRAPWFAEAEGRARVHSLPPPAPERSRGADTLAEGGFAPPPDPLRAARRPWPGAGWAAANVASVNRGPGSSGTTAADVNGTRGADGRAMAPVALPPDASARLDGGLRYVGDVDGAFWLCEMRDVLVLLDPHTFHEQLLLRQLGEAYAKGELRSRRLLFPMPIDLGAPTRLEPVATTTILRELGVEADFGPGERPGRLVLRALPALVGDADPKPLMLGLLAVLEANGGAHDDPSTAPTSPPRAEADVKAQLLAVLACEGSVRAGETPPRTRTLELLSQVGAVFDGPSDLDSGRVCRRGRRLCWLLALSDVHAHFGSP